MYVRGVVGGPRVFAPRALDAMRLVAGQVPPEHRGKTRLYGHSLYAAEYCTPSSEPEFYLDVKNSKKKERNKRDNPTLLGGGRGKESKKEKNKKKKPTGDGSGKGEKGENGSEKGSEREDEKWPPFVHIVVSDDGYMEAEAVYDINELDMLVSKGEGLVDLGDGQTFDWHYGFAVDEQGALTTKGLEERMWFCEQWDYPPPDEREQDEKEEEKRFWKDGEVGPEMGEKNEKNEKEEKKPHPSRFWVAGGHGCFQVAGMNNEDLFHVAVAVTKSTNSPTSSTTELKLVAAPLLQEWRRIIAQQQKRREQNDRDWSSMHHVLYYWSRFLLSSSDKKDVKQETKEEKVQ
jgi:hypothetical protein